MSDYEVNLVNDSMQEFFVRFYGPKESTSIPIGPFAPLVSLDHCTRCTDEACWPCVRRDI
jgi:hypothetical protein